MDDINFYDPVFDVEFCRFLLNDANQQLVSGAGFTRTNFHWDDNIVRVSAPVLVRDYDKNMSALILAQLLNSKVIEDNNYNVMNYAWTRMSYIPWHKDSKYSHGITIYLNDIWDRDWGGIYLYMSEPDREVKGYIPRFNTGLKNSKKISHSTTPVSLDAAALRLTLQLFPRSTVASAG